MLTNYLKIALRTYLRDRSFTGLNLASLIIGLFVVYTAISYIRYELSYDTFHKNADSVYRLARTQRSQDYSIVGFPNWSEATATDQRQPVDALTKLTGVQAVAQFITSNAPEFIEAGDRRIQEGELLTTNTPRAFCSMFSWTLRSGSFQNFAEGTNKVILTASTARKLFGETAPDSPELIQRPLIIAGTTYIIAAIINDVPANSHLTFNLALNRPRLDYWGSRVYVQLADKYEQADAEQQINAIIPAINPALAKDPLYKGHFLQPITGIHLKSNILYEFKPPGNVNYMILIGGFALFILIITLFNYANLSLALKSKQSRTIGVRKALGAANAAIAVQFVIESLLLSLAALPVVGLLVLVFMPYINAFMGVQINPNVFGELDTLLTLGAVAVGIGLVAGLLPATLLAWQSAVNLFKDNLRSNLYQRFSVRKYLVITQFVSLICIASVSWFVSRQLVFVAQKDLGFQTKNLLYAYSSAENQQLFQEKLRQIPGIKSVGNGSSFGIMPFNQVTYKLTGSNDIYDDAHQLYLDYNALNAYQLKTVPATISPTNSPTNGILINQTAAEKIAAGQGVPINGLIGKTIVTEPENEGGQGGVPFVVAGIFADINLFSLHEKVDPYFIRLSENVRMDGRSIIAYDPAAAPTILADIQAVYDGLNEPFPLEVTYLDEQLAGLYRQDRQTADLLISFTLIAVVLSALGIVGISIFLTVARTKEIGIRRVLGASAFSIVKSAATEYVWLVAVALLISVPVAFYAVRAWLNNFAYHIDIQPGVFVGAGLFTLLLTLLIVGLIAYRAALVNPVNSLRSE